MKSLRIAGDELSEVIMHFIRDEYNLEIGEQTAELVKTEIGAVYVHSDPKTISIRGRNILTGLPQEIEVSSDVLRLPLSKQTRPITDAVKSALEEAPPELVADVMSNGIYVAGGGGLIAGLERLIQQETKIECKVADNALTAVVEGSARSLKNFAVSQINWKNYKWISFQTIYGISVFVFPII